MDVHAPVGPDQKAFVKYLATMFSVLAKKVMVKWSMTQVLSSDSDLCHVQTQPSEEAGSLQITHETTYFGQILIVCAFYSKTDVLGFAASCNHVICVSVFLESDI